MLGGDFVALASTYDGKVRVINDILDKSSPDEREIMLKMLIKRDMKTYFDVIWQEEKRLEKESGVDCVESYEEFVDSHAVDFDSFDSGLEVDKAGKVSKEAENAYYLDEKLSKKQGNDRFDGFLGYVNSSGTENCDSRWKKVDDEDNGTVLQPDDKTTLAKNEGGLIEEI